MGAVLYNAGGVVWCVVGFPPGGTANSKARNPLVRGVPVSVVRDRVPLRVAAATHTCKAPGAHLGLYVVLGGWVPPGGSASEQSM